MIKFKGDKAELHAWLKEWSEKSDRTMNGKILELINEFKEQYGQSDNRPT